jgi:hypothetical protein
MDLKNAKGWMPLQDCQIEQCHAGYYAGKESSSARVRRLGLGLLDSLTTSDCSHRGVVMDVVIITRSLASKYNYFLEQTTTIGKVLPLHSSSCNALAAKYFDMCHR